MSTITLLEKYEPKTLADLYLPSRVRTLITETTTDRVGWRIFQPGTRGTGKTSVAKVISKGGDVLYLSGSNDFNVEVMRKKVYPFVSAHSVMNRQKFLIVDECENINNKIQDAFKIVLDQCKSVNFVFNTNEPENVIPEIKSRCTNIPYDYQGHEIKDQQGNYVLYAKKICDENNIQYDNPGLKELYLINFPDFRHLLIVLQQFIDSKKSVTKDNVKILSESGTVNEELYRLIEEEHNPQAFYEGVTTFKNKERECLISLGEPYLAYLISRGKFEQCLKAASIVADYSFRYVTTINKFGTFFACVIELKAIFR
jgi:DNA polymerase III gamma/tau subunit